MKHIIKNETTTINKKAKAAEAVTIGIIILLAFCDGTVVRLVGTWTDVCEERYWEDNIVFVMEVVVCKTVELLIVAVCDMREMTFVSTLLIVEMAEEVDDETSNKQ